MHSMNGRVLLLLCSLVWHQCWLTRGCQCPWEDETLEKWSNNETWGDALVPTTGSQVLIPNGKRILLDVQPAPLYNLTIEAGGHLIWGYEDNFVLDTHYIYIKGEFHIGSEFCRFDKKARIRLHGISNDDCGVDDHGFGRKFIGLVSGAALELHGKKKTPWTKLAQTVPIIEDVTCSVIYNHTNYTQNKAKSHNRIGLNVLVWNQEGAFMDFSVFASFDASFPEFLESLPTNSVIGMRAFGDDGMPKITEELVNATLALGGTVISNVEKKNGYSFLGKKGSPETVSEFVTHRNDDGDMSIDYLRYHDQERHMVFEVAKNEWTAKRSMMFRILPEDMAYPKLTFIDEVVGWSDGDEVVLTSTDYDWEQAEVRRIYPCPECSKRQIRIDAPMTYMHFGNYTNGVDERGEVAMLTRSIVIEGVMESECKERIKEEKDEKLCTKFGRDTFGGHIKIMRGFKSAHIRGVQLLHMGQQNYLGKYPVHFHMCDEVPNAYLKENAVVDSFSRCFTIHGTHQLDVMNNVCYLHLGHGMFLEDAVEQENNITGNLVFGTMHGTLTLADRKKEWCNQNEEDFCQAVASFWLSHPYNYITNNVAAGGEGKGFIYIFADLPLGPSRARQEELNKTHHPKDMPLFFEGNVAHSYRIVGLHMDEKISTGTGIEGAGNVDEGAIIRVQNEYDPHIDGVPAWVEMKKSMFYKNGFRGVWVKGGNVRLSYCGFADSKESFTGGTTLTESGTEAYKSVFIGESDNKGLPKSKTINGTLIHFDRSYHTAPTDSLTAVSIYQGPNIIDSCFFDRYSTVQWCLNQETPVSECPPNLLLTRHAGALSFLRSNIYPTTTSTYSINNTFGFCDDPDKGLNWVFHGDPSIPDWPWKDGNKGVYLLDRDGGLTGTVNASIVGNFPLFLGDECQKRENWNMHVCPYRYIKLNIRGDGGHLSPSKAKDYPLIIRRDDPDYNEPYSIMGESQNEYLLRTHRSFLLDFNTSLEGGGYPSRIKVHGFGVEKGDVVRLGICVPMNVTGFGVLMDYPVFIKNNATWLDSLEALDNDTTGKAFYHDKENGVLFLKLLSFHYDTNETQQCPDGKCFKVSLDPIGGDRENLRNCSHLVIPPYKDTTEVKAKPQTPACPGIGSPVGLGPLNWENLGYVEYDDLTLSCIDPDDNPAGLNPVKKGCYKQRYQKVDQPLKTSEMVLLQQTMTLDFCFRRCYYRNYTYAALRSGSRCSCSNLLYEGGYKIPEAEEDAKCFKNCKGNSSETCGGSSHLSVWTTGI